MEFFLVEIDELVLGAMDFFLVEIDELVLGAMDFFLVEIDELMRWDLFISTFSSKPKTL